MRYTQHTPGVEAHRETNMRDAALAAQCNGHRALDASPMR
jgi:hypothetical protein